MVDDVEEGFVLEGSLDTLLVVELLVDLVFLCVCPWGDFDVDLDSRGEGAEEADADGEADEGGHGAVWDGRGEADVDAGGRVVDVDEGELDHVQLLQRQWVLRVVDVADQVKHLLCIDRLSLRVIVV